MRRPGQRTEMASIYTHIADQKAGTGSGGVSPVGVFWTRVGLEKAR